MLTDTFIGGCICLSSSISDTNTRNAKLGDWVNVGVSIRAIARVCFVKVDKAL
jgi:hypothetical protein